jgi:cytochrome c peroxidase
MFLIFAFLTSFMFAQNEALPEMPPVPKGNLQSAEKIELGKMLFFDPRLSYDGSVSCNSCHNVMNGGSDNRSFSVGVNGQKGGRSAGTVLNSAFYSVQFWDGRAVSLEEQAKGPLTNPIEMGNKNHDIVMGRVKKIEGYVAKFNSVFGKKNSMTIDNLAKAIASYERTLITPNSAFDKYKKGDAKALSKIELEGYKTFQSVGCVTCHSGANFSGPTLPEGVGFYMKFPTFSDTAFDKKYKFTDDKGRFDVTKNNNDLHMFRVPTLRNIALTAPYFHNGSVLTLDEAVKVMGKTQLNKDLTAKEVKSLVAFLNALSGTLPPQTMPQLPPTPNHTVVDPK